ncbi:MAG: GNAT family N-acetyltransferase, partial [Acidobacteria bacterium]|nr:GNAT family N-acetyltransferase [Acidobacteriota bacterium]
MFSHSLDEQTELRLFEERHAAALLALIESNRARHPEIPQLRTLEEAQGYIKRDLALWAENKGLGVGIWLRGELAGGIRYHEIDWHNRSTELGYWLGAEFEGYG